MDIEHDIQKDWYTNKAWHEIKNVSLNLDSMSTLTNVCE